LSAHGVCFPSRGDFSKVTPLGPPLWGAKPSLWPFFFPRPKVNFPRRWGPFPWSGGPVLLFTKQKLGLGALCSSELPNSTSGSSPPISSLVYPLLNFPRGGTFPNPFGDGEYGFPPKIFPGDFSNTWPFSWLVPLLKGDLFFFFFLDGTFSPLLSGEVCPAGFSVLSVLRSSPHHPGKLSNFLDKPPPNPPG